MIATSFAQFSIDMKIEDWISAIATLIAALALIFTALGVRQQAKAADFANYMDLKERFANAWRMFRDSEGDDRKTFEFIELMNLIEASCHLYNKGAIRGASEEMLGDYLTEILPMFFGNEQAKDLITKHFSGPDTFFHIRRFARSHGIEGVPQQ